MAQLVFVHGVANRDTPKYRSAIANRDMLFRKLLFTAREVDIHSPMWGRFVPDIPAGIFDTDRGVRAFSLGVKAPPGLGGGLMGAPPTAGDASDISIGVVGKQMPTAALDAIGVEIIERAAREERELKPEELSAFRKAFELIDAAAAATVFAGDADAESIASQLTAGAPGAYGIGSLIGDAVSAVTDRIRNELSTLGYGAIRDRLGPAVGMFIGDVFVYLRDGERREKIRNEVMQALCAAHDGAKATNEPLVVVGHSMGGVILADMLVDPAAAGLPKDIHIDALLTVGSQPGLFAALDVLPQNAPGGAARRKPDCVAHWLNVFDPIDPLAFRADALFQDVTDLSFDSVTGITEAHSKYFQRPQFYARTRRRLQEFKIL